MRVVFIGASSFGLRCLTEIHKLPDMSIVGVLTNPKTFNISYSEKPVTNVLHADFVEWAEAHALPCHEMVGSMRDVALLEWAQSLTPDLFVVIGWYHMVPKSLREIAPAIGLHASLLPDYSGGAPLVWAMINGESKTGITLFQMDDGIDSGPIIGQAEEAILYDDTIASLYARIEERGLELLRQHLPLLSQGAARLRIQDESARRVFPQRSPTDGWIEWNQNAVVVDRFIRAQTRPYPGAFTSLNAQKLTIWAAKPISENSGQTTGGVAMVDGAYYVQCSSGSLMLQEINYQGQVLMANQLQGVLLDGGQQLGLHQSQASVNSQ